MKIRPTQSPQRVVPTEREAQRSTSADDHGSASQPAAQVSRSAFARAIEDVREAPVRRDLVAEVRAQLAAGTFEDSVSLDTVVDSLLADL